MPAYPWRPLSPLARALTGFLIAEAALSALEAAIELSRRAGLQGVTAPIGSFSGELRSVTSPLAPLSTALPIVVGITWLVWQHRAHADLWARGIPALRFTPGWSVGWWFVPFASLVQPFRAVRELWRHSGAGGGGAGDWLVPAWWSLYLASAILVVFALVPIFSALFRGATFYATESGPVQIVTISAGSLRSVSTWLAVTAFLRVVAVVPAIALVRAISRAEDASHGAALALAIPPRPDLS